MKKGVGNKKNNFILICLSIGLGIGALCAYIFESTWFMVCGVGIGSSLGIVFEYIRKKIDPKDRK